jgi:hypothetical protein
MPGWNCGMLLHRHGEDRVRLQLNDTDVLFTFLPYDTRDLQIQKYLTSIGSNGVYYTRRRSNVELALDLPSLKVKDAAFGTALHEFAESYFPRISRTASPKPFSEHCNGRCCDSTKTRQELVQDKISDYNCHFSDNDAVK